uniref:Phosphatidylinositol-specific phospholipase C, X domain containing 3 n=1 Tax=Poecilia reticulata TaxID=8081 RepID=A0A3P9PRB9_POERE
MASSHGRSDLRFADWMASLPQSMHTVPLANMAIPGSHDSFSFYIDEASPVGPEQPETVQNFVSVFGTVAKKLMRKWLATQTMNFTSQLEAGIRFFDLRISTKPRDPDNELYFAHGLFSATVREGLEQISSFLSAHAKEVVFLDFNHFYGVQNLHHEKLVAMLKEIFGEKLCPVVFAQEVTLKYLWEKEYQVLVFYHHPMALEVPFLWPGQMMPAPWANTTDPEKLVQFLQASVTDRRRKGTFFVSQVVLTPKASTVMKGVASGLRETITERYLFQREAKKKKKTPNKNIVMLVFSITIGHANHVEFTPIRKKSNNHLGPKLLLHLKRQRSLRWHHLPITTHGVNTQR